MPSSHTSPEYAQAGPVEVPIMAPGYQVVYPDNPLTNRIRLGIRTMYLPNADEAPGTYPDFESAPVYRGYGNTVQGQTGAVYKRYFQPYIDNSNATIAALHTQLSAYQALADEKEAQYDADLDYVTEAKADLATALAARDAASIELRKAAINLAYQQRAGAAVDAAETRREAAQTQLNLAAESYNEAVALLATAESDAGNSHLEWTDAAAQADILENYTIPSYEFALGVFTYSQGLAYADPADGDPPPDPPLEPIGYYTAAVGGGGINASLGSNYNHSTSATYQWTVVLTGREYAAAVGSGITGFRITWYEVSYFVPATGAKSTENSEFSEVIPLSAFETNTDEDDNYYGSGVTHDTTSPIAPPGPPTVGSAELSFSAGYQKPYTSVEVEVQGAAIPRIGFFGLTTDGDGECARYGTAEASATEAAPDGNDYPGTISVGLVTPTPTDAGYAQWKTIYNFPDPDPDDYNAARYIPPDVANSALARDRSWGLSSQPAPDSGLGASYEAPPSEEGAILRTMTPTTVELDSPVGLRWDLSSPITSANLAARVAEYVDEEWPPDVAPPPPGPDDPVPPPRKIGTARCFDTPVAFAAWGQLVQTAGAGKISPADGNFRAAQKLRYRASYYLDDRRTENSLMLPFRIKRWTTNLTTGHTTEDFITINKTVSNGGPSSPSDRYQAIDAGWTEIAPTENQMVQIFSAESADYDASHGLIAWLQKPFLAVAVAD